MSSDEPKVLRKAWQGEQEAPLILSVEQLRQRSWQFRRRLWMRNAAEYGAAAVIAVVNGFYMWLFHSMLMRVGAALMMVGLVYIVLQLHRRGSARALPLAAAPSLDFLIGELSRQRDLLRNVWEWYLLPLFPGITVFLFGASKLRDAGGSLIVPERSIVMTTALVVVGFALIAFANRANSRGLQRQIDALERLRD